MNIKVFHTFCYTHIIFTTPVLYCCACVSICAEEQQTHPLIYSATLFLKGQKSHFAEGRVNKYLLATTWMLLLFEIVRGGRQLHTNIESKLQWQTFACLKNTNPSLFIRNVFAWIRSPPNMSRYKNKLWIHFHKTRLQLWELKTFTSFKRVKIIQLMYVNSEH